MSHDREYIFTSESVTEGHPDKMADQISDAVLDAMLAQDPDSRVACETMITTGLVVLAGEITSKATIDFQEVVRKKITEIGYDHSDKGFDSTTCSVMVALDKQSPDIAQGVNTGEGAYAEQGAGDQGLMFGYAVNETPELMPLPIALSHRLAEKMSQMRKNGKLGYLRPDGKTQVSVLYKGRKPLKVTSVVMSSQHDAGITQEQIHKDLKEMALSVIPAEFATDDIEWLINPTGVFVIGGPMGDCGLTGRKIIVDTYGGRGRHGGGAFSGKDASKVDRSAAYAARYVAKNVVASGAAEECEVQVAYAIGYPEPVSISINCFGTEKVDEGKIEEAIKTIFPLNPAWIVKHLDLKKPIFSKTSAYGHFGRENLGFSWEETNKVDEIKKALGL
ncbi:MAG: methionine adenosyltransferase [SAR324 cluster bacterium]|nr:methionine adenosyltransferase [SAR324 cluster bacterium]